MAKKKPSSMLYKIQRQLYKGAQVVQDIEDLVAGKPNKAVKRHAKRVVHRKSHKSVAKILRKIGL